MIPCENYNSSNFTSDELRTVAEAKALFAAQNPPKLSEGFFDIKATAYVDDVTNWYDKCDDIINQDHLEKMHE